MQRLQVLVQLLVFTDMGILGNNEVLWANLFTAFHEREGIIFHMNISALQSLIFYNPTPESVSMAHAQLQSRITKPEAKKTVWWRRTLSRLPEELRF